MTVVSSYCLLNLGLAASESRCFFFFPSNSLAVMVLLSSYFLSTVKVHTDVFFEGPSQGLADSNLTPLSSLKQFTQVLIDPSLTPTFTTISLVWSPAL
ncbi:hypothetical protein E2C01_076528 [Portunus trituberculatus]|uniref:Uncharacterized protein n=1 Tax=Portunus trituberculatus TaxID=210409 RepID=A0A5B7IBU4_PORTR|nr:hypothetical protein [Portunus trituberculatus]